MVDMDMRCLGSRKDLGWLGLVVVRIVRASNSTGSEVLLPHLSLTQGVALQLNAAPSRVSGGLRVLAKAAYGWTGQQSSSGFCDLAPSILHYNWF
jgi:hypothetical protein